jgi:hypothetical protein
VSRPTATLDRPPARLLTWLPARIERARYWYRSLPLLAAALAGCVAVVWTWAAEVYYTAPHGFVDLAVYRFGVRAWWHGGNLYGQLPPTVAGHLPYVYPPVSVLLLGPLDLVSWGHAIIMTLAGSLIGLAVVLYLTFLRICPEAGRRGALLATAVLVPAALLLEPVWDTLWFGQVNILLMVLVMVDCLAVGSRWPRGVLIGIAAAVKLTPAVFLLYFLLRKDVRAAVRMTVTAVTATVLGFVVSWSGSLKYWFGSGRGRSAARRTTPTRPSTACSPGGVSPTWRRARCGCSARPCWPSSRRSASAVPPGRVTRCWRS